MSTMLIRCSLHDELTHEQFRDWIRGRRDEIIGDGSAVTAVHGASERSVPEVAWSPVAGLGIGSALRRLADAGERCVLHLTDGTTYDVVLRRVGADFVEATVGEGRMVLVAFAALAAVQSRD